MTRTQFHRYAPLVAVCVLWYAAGEPKSVLGQSGDATAADTPDFEAAIAPLLVKRCLECHNALQAAGGLVFATREGALAGGDSGPALVPGDLDASYLMARVTSGEMPPAKQGIPQSLDEAEIDLLRRWIKSGASWPEGRMLDPYEATSDSRGGRDWWSFQKVVRPPLPAVQTKVRVRTPIDAFIVGALEAQGMEMAPEADDRTILRRLYEDVLGLPASPEQVEMYVSDTRPDKYERLVDRLLASPHFGERWGRYWLDLVRFAETCGYERDQTKPNAWRYRDWVVQSVNQDRPYDRFVVEQLAGDEVADRSEQTVIGTGFLRLGTWNDEPNDPHEYKYERLEDMVHATGTAFLGLTIKCARCHDHKFDPIPQTDYYKMASAFWPGPIEPRGSELLGGVSAAELGYDVLGWTDLSPSASPLHLLVKGDPQRPAQEVEPGYLTLSPELLVGFAPPPADAKTSHRRLQWANWIVDPRNPLTARVAVNRLWQHHFEAGLVRTPNNFGFKGERPTHPELLDWLTDEFVGGGWTLKRLHRLILYSSVYRQSALHPQREEYELRDSGNRLWWHSPRRRLDAEALRDAMLAASGQIDLSIGGPSFFAEVSADALEGLSMKGNAWQASPAAAQRRRSLYMFSKRSLISPLMTVFDFCDTTLPCEQRDVTTVAPQALALLNNAFSHRMSEALANRTAAQAGPDSQARIRRAWHLVLARSPTPGELQAAQEHLDRQARRFAEQGDLLNRYNLAPQKPPPTPDMLALTSLCHVLLNTNEFIYVD